MSINAWDIDISMLLSFTFRQHKNFIMFFFYFLVIFSIFLAIPVVREKIKVNLALAIQTGAPAIPVNEIIDTPLVAAFKTIKILSI